MSAAEYDADVLVAADRAEGEGPDEEGQALDQTGERMIKPDPEEAVDVTG